MQIINVLIHQPIGLLRIQTDTELEGWCFGVGPDDGQKIQQELAGVLIDQNPIDRERLWLALLRLDTGQDAALRGYIDTALWDLVAKAVEQPVYRMTGGFRSRTPAYLVGDSHDDSEGVVQEALRAQRDGFLGYKITCLQSQDSLFGLIREIRQQVGADFYLMLDGAGQNDSAGAVQIGRILDEADFYWYEEPLEEGNLSSCRLLAERIDTPVALRVRTSRDVSRILSVQAADMVIAGTPFSGGITDLLKIGRAADAFGVFSLMASAGVSCGFAHAHLLGSMKNAPFFEARQAGVVEDTPCINNPLKVVDGYLEIPKSPGLGMDLNWDAIDEKTEQIIEPS